MCGIAGSINISLDIPRLTRDMYHRGPDEQSTEKIDQVILHHHRLAILDIAGGRQPMHLGSLTIIFNGEIYNHLEVRKKLDLACQSNSDTETILHAYRKAGADCLKEFDGMFALAIFDGDKNELFLARDRAGKKPLYVYQQGNRFAFASELNALKGQLTLETDDRALHQFVRLGYFYKDYTAYQHIREVPPGHFAILPLHNRQLQIKSWWNIHDYYQQRQTDSFEEALSKTDQYLHAAVRRRVESSDLEVGSFLSGGIDSGIVTAIASEYNSSLQTFTVSFQGEYDEAPLARLVAERYGTRHVEIPISFDHLLQDVEKILGNYGEPFFDSSAIPSYYVSREARKHLTVILNGDGGDELFGGYRRYVPFARYDFFKTGALVKNMASLANRLMPVPHNKKSKYNYVYRLTDLARKNGLATYLSSTIDSFEGYEQWLNPPANYLQEVEQDFEAMVQSDLSGLQKLMNLDFNNILAGNLLVKMDIATMAHSLEGRSPLLCKEFLEYVPGLPDSYKIKGSQTKYLLRTLAEKYLPAELIHQPKRGFEIPLKKWIDQELKDLIASYLLPKDAYSRQFVKDGFVDKLWNRQLKTGDEKRAKMIWTLFVLDVWYKRQA